ncbi:MAG: type I DNA topoisomerase, partial [Planctomycetes bacterium]|nr:type I DNA topoisomerase [Planctomycetota bacterium]
YVVKASIGHVRDLPRSKLGIDIENGFTPKYMTIRGKKPVMDELKKYARDASHIFLATDPDREGEAIAWHLVEGLNLNKDKTQRVEFNEITKAAILRAFEHPRDIMSDLVDAQQARRVLDRIVGYSISPILWRKVAKGLSAGRVQSVAQKLICEREREIAAFKPEEYWSISAFLMKADVAKKLSAKEHEKLKATLRALHGGEGEAKDWIDSEEEVDTESATEPQEKVKLPDYMFRADLKKWRGETPKLSSGEQVKEITQRLDNADFKVSGVETKERKDRPKPPFITSTLQQVASMRMGFTAKRTMRTAQQLYEGIELGSEGATGMITYMRTDSVHISDFAVNDAREVIRGQFGEKYLPEQGIFYKTSSKAQAAHEAIRPTNIFRTPESVREYMNTDQFKLYKLIWDRFVACQMLPAVYNITTIEITADEALFRVSGKSLVFDGHTRVSGLKLDSGEQLLPPLAQNEALSCETVKGDQHFTQPPPRFSEASLVRTLEKEGIGRPSTYASIISTIVDRGYVTLDKRRFFATELGMLINDLLVNNFSRIVNTEFTAKMEEQLDRIEEGKLPWADVMGNFYALFKDELAEAEQKIEKIKGLVAKDGAGNEIVCQLCNSPMVVRWSKNGKFLGCSNFPECKGTMPLDREGKPILLRKEDIECTECKSPMVVRMGKRGPFLGCSTFPKCRGTRALEAAKTPEEKEAERKYAGLLCGKCSSPMAVRQARSRLFLGCTAYPTCRNAIGPKKADIAIEKGEMKIDPEAREKVLANLIREAELQQGIKTAS